MWFEEVSIQVFITVKEALRSSRMRMLREWASEERRIGDFD